MQPIHPTEAILRPEQPAHERPSQAHAESRNRRRSELPAPLDRRCRHRSIDLQPMARPPSSGRWNETAMFPNAAEVLSPRLPASPVRAASRSIDLQPLARPSSSRRWNGTAVSPDNTLWFFRTPAPCRPVFPLSLLPRLHLLPSFIWYSSSPSRERMGSEADVVEMTGPHRRRRQQWGYPLAQRRLGEKENHLPMY
ncbi:hypothetical protein BRADI_1g38916v3 [Brachypodium distachyon]|uniref:Uncharacterized protein n=1 Tax=Brachypodium distachyon TaxID=15368 RepID=A0A2K2DNI2_BRADI|nr:hypothetical protein BRADI_1g38916v3 [Brachypodium distachyon]